LRTVPIGKLINSRWAAIALVFGLVVIGLAGEKIYRNLTPPTPVPLAAIHRYTERYVGERVVVVGTVRMFDDPGGRYYVLEDPGQNRILLDAPSAQLANLVGQGATATGTVGFDERRGIYLTVRALSPLRANPPAGELLPGVYPS
jgi:hypothetical protein